MEVEVDIEGWPAGDWEALADRAAMAVREVAGELASPRLSISVLFTGDEDVHALNREWRNRDKPTNVLSFPMQSREELLALEAQGPPVLLGDIALAHATCEREATDKGVPLEHHAAHLIVHGLLHLAGHDHVDSDAQAEAMEALEITALAKMGIGDPYADRDMEE